METTILTAEDVRTALAPMTLRQIDRLAQLSGVPAPTIYKIKLNVTANPGIETVGLFWPYVTTVIEEAKPPPP